MELPFAAVALPLIHDPTLSSKKGGGYEGIDALRQKSLVGLNHEGFQGSVRPSASNPGLHTQYGILVHRRSIVPDLKNAQASHTKPKVPHRPIPGPTILCGRLSALYPLR